ncbi:MAG: fibronectin type III domain-containing protein [Sedimentisphaerales bacterium]|nr:fibronectin type III domain-containing protein [Sedimentisphaerales bacterium]
MPRFPKREPEIMALAERLVSGFRSNLALFPAPPVVWPILNIKRSLYYSARNALLAKQAAAEQSIADKDTALEELIDALKSNLRYAENTVDFDDDKLKLIGWSGKNAPTALAPPGEVRQLEAPKQGDGWLFLDWKQPAEGGRVSAYKIQRRQRPEGAWQEVGTAIETESTLVDQPKGKELEYRIIAINKSGEGSPSNTVMAVL